MSLNSCNIIIPTFEDINIKYILAVLNSRIVQYYFDKCFNSIKILRTHIENIPIPKIGSKEQKSVIEKVDCLIKVDKKEKANVLYEEIDNEIAKAYDIDAKEYMYIKNIYKEDELFLLK